MRKCCRCELELEEKMFFKSKKNYKSNYMCKACFNSYTTERWVCVKEWAIKRMGGCCQDCKQIFHYSIYEFHHLRDKDNNWSKIRLRSKIKIKEELEKCVLLCCNCHRMRHKNDNYKYDYHSPRNLCEKTGKFKICFRCKNNKDTSEFYNRKDRKSGIASSCKDCQNNLSVLGERKRKQKAVELMGGKCFDCKNIFENCIYDFHHLYGKDKNWTTVKKVTEKKAKEELKKCVMLCANCHKIRHIVISHHASKNLPPIKDPTLKW